jgi:hypothetical protein
MARNVLLVLEIVLALAAFAGGANVVFRNRQVLAEEERSTPPKLRVVLDMVLLDAILAAMVLSAWMLYSNMSFARWMSIIAGAVLLGALGARPNLAGGRQWLAATLALLGIVVVALAILLPSGG